MTASGAITEKYSMADPDVVKTDQKLSANPTFFNECKLRFERFTVFLEEVEHTDKSNQEVYSRKMAYFKEKLFNGFIQYLVKTQNFQNLENISHEQLSELVKSYLLQINSIIEFYKLKDGLQIAEVLNSIFD
jgi:hypothetical protein